MDANIVTLIGILVGAFTSMFGVVFAQRKTQKKEQAEQFAQINEKLDGTHKEICAVSEKVAVLQKVTEETQRQVEEEKAIEAGVRVINFDEECIQRMEHTDTQWISILKDCDLYEATYAKYERTDKPLENGRTCGAVGRIRKRHSLLKEEGKL